MQIKKLTYGGLIIALAILLPQALHLAAGPEAGKLLLPMHLPVLLGGFILGPVFGLVIGVLSPLISTLLTGMPSFDRLMFMIPELAAYGFFSGLLYNKLKRKSAGTIISLVGGMLAGRIVNAAALFIAANLFGIPCGGAIAAVNATLTGIYGIVFQLIVIPPVVIALERSGFLDKHIRAGKPA